MSFYCFYQQNGGEEAWQPSLATQRAELAKSKKPRFMTVLDVDALVDPTFTREQIEALRYKGPLYMDFDGDLKVVISKVQQLLEKLQELEVNVDAVRWYATGGRGFHCEIPAELFLEKPNPKGYQHLPAIYKEMVYALYTDTMDLRVYSARKGRMWRTPNVQRENLAFKVPLTPTEVATLTVEDYAEYCKAPRDVVVAAPTFSHKLAVMFAQAEDKILKASKSRKSTEADKKLLTKFLGKTPPTVARIAAGEGIKPDVGFHNIAMQLAITANALGRSEAEFIAECQGVIHNHQSDGFRYNTPARREAELLRMYRYTSDNPCYTYAKAPIKALVLPEIDTSDLDGMTESAGQEVAAADTDDYGLLGNVSMRENGVFCKDQEGVAKMICNVSFDDVYVVKSIPDGSQPSETWGFDALIKVKGVSQGRKSLPIDTFSTRAKLNGFAMKVSGIMTGTDNQAAAISQLMHSLAASEDRVQYVVKREGLDVVINPETREAEMIWVGDGKVTAAAGKDSRYVYKSNSDLYGTGLYCSKLIEEKELQGTEEEERVIRALLTMNDPAPLGKLIGWMMACYYRPVYHKVYHQFPLLHSYGQAGSGKTETTLLLSRLHYDKDTPVKHYSLPNATPKAVTIYVSSSSSMPVMFDEYVKAWVRKDTWERFRGSALGIYNGALDVSAGGSMADGNTNFQVVTAASLTGPTVYISETLESKQNMMDRSIIVPMSRGGISGRSSKFEAVQEGQWVLSRIGHMMAWMALATDPKDNFAAFREEFKAYRVKAKEVMDEKTADRPLYNHAVIMKGFADFTAIVRSKFGERLEEELKLVGMTLLKPEELDAPIPMGEAVASIDTLALISRTENHHSPYRIQLNDDYAFAMQGSTPCVDIIVQECFTKLLAWSRNKGSNVFFDNAKAFEHGVKRCKPCVDGLAIDSPLRQKHTGKNVKILRLSLEELEAEGCGLFLGQDHERS